ncbi:non-specific lipid-transfer protein 1-like [Impatiens glandulifera]|uniref:non-specific lipid-transfer protein 1-like n=1 Tax=Impatiens glandulifera TaxID=253017 RepID=UPI001FB10CC2|nr:non-specific lipid-transfer protein 1-like [Impatiens glandulifera]
MAVAKIVVAVMTMVMIMMFSTETAAELKCGTVFQTLSPCLGYIRTSGDKKPLPACCNGVRSLNEAAVTTPDRQTACNCLKQVATGYSPAIVAVAATIPAKCGVSIPYKIDPTTDCSKVH